MKNKITVMVVDDSALVRQTLTNILNSDSDIEVIAAAADPYAAAKKMEERTPDVITLDIEMPRMDGLTFLRKIMSQHPLPVVICSSLTDKGSDEAIKAMEYGAVDIITKPKMGTKKFLEESTIRICDAVKAAGMSKAKKIKPKAEKQAPTEPRQDADAVMPRARSKGLTTTEKILLVGASTGGTEALRIFLEAFPSDVPGIVIVQHMPEHFTAAFAKRLDAMCRISVREAKDNDTVLRGQALIAPGNKHTLLKRSGARYYVEVKDGPLVSRHRPSVDVLFRSGASYAGKNVVAAIMTGMGDDGARGMRELFEAGAFCIAQDEATSVVYGMPQEAVKRGAVHKVMPLQSIAQEMIKQARDRS